MAKTKRRRNYRGQRNRNISCSRTGLDNIPPSLFWHSGAEANESQRSNIDWLACYTVIVLL
uniref:Uncharacterized protein n=1 Tax=Anguilla anguilla TaxID=7936 RepID=A0A0E9WTX0_ANGAN